MMLQQIIWVVVRLKHRALQMNSLANFEQGNHPYHCYEHVLHPVYSAYYGSSCDVETFNGSKAMPIDIVEWPIKVIHHHK